MTQPRKEQIHSANTKFVLAGYSIIPHTSETVLSPSDLNPYFITDIPNGAELDVPASVKSSNNSPYAILGGDAINIRINSGPIQTVTFVGTDIITSRVATKINSVIGSDIAFDLGGVLQLRTPGAGASQSIVLSDAGPSVLAKLGLVAGTYTGFDGPTRGILTQTPDLKGGEVLLTTRDSIPLTTEAVHAVHAILFGKLIRTVDIPGGLAIRGRIIFDGTNYRIKYYVNLPSPAYAYTYNSNFAALDGTDSITFNVDGNSFVISFPSPPYTRDQVIDRINQQYASNVGGISYARVISTVTGPYNGPGSQFSISVDGGAPQVINIGASTHSATDLAAAIQSQLTGAIATTIIIGSKQFISIQSSNANGLTSSIEISTAAIGFTQMPSATFLRMIGLMPGIYKGAYIAEPYGASDIRIRSWTRGSTSQIIVTGNPTTLIRMGLVASTITGDNAALPNPVLAPRMRAALSDASAYEVQALLPEVQEFGDIKPDMESGVQSFLAKALTSGPITRGLDFAEPASGAGTSSGIVTNGIFSAGRSVVADPMGVLPESVAQSIYDWFDNTIRQTTRLNSARDTIALVTNNIRSTGNDGNPVPRSPTFLFDLDPDNFYNGAPKHFIARWASETGSTFDAFEYAHESGNPGLSDYLNIKDAPLYNSNGPLRLADANTETAGSAFFSDKYLRISSVSHPNLQIGDVPFLGAPNTSAYCLLQSINAGRSQDGKTTIVCGDGTLSKGDFEGPDAISKAIAYCNFRGITFARFIIKRGDYTNTTPYNFSTFDHIEIISACVPQSNFAGFARLINQVPGPILTGPNVGGMITLKGLDIKSTAAQDSPIIQIIGASHVELENILYQHGHIEITNLTLKFSAKNVTTVESTFGTSTPASVRFIWNTTTFVDYIRFEDAFIGSQANSPIVRLELTGAPGSIFVNEITFEGGSYFPGRVDNVGGNLQNGGGVIDFLPGTAEAYVGAGLRIGKLRLYDCNISTNSLGSGSPIFFHICPTGFNGPLAYNYGTDPVVSIDNVHIRGGTWTNASDSTTSPHAMIVGVGIGSSSNNSFKARGKLTIEGITFDTGLSKYGPMTLCGASFMQNYGSGGISENVSGFLVASGWDVTVRDIRFINLISQPDFPDIFINGYGESFINHIIMEDWTVLTPGAIPVSRIFLRPFNSFTKITVDDVRLNNDFTVGDWYANAVVLLTPNSDNDLNSPRLVIRNVQVNGMVFPTANNAAMILLSSDFTSWASAPTGFSGIIIELCQLDGSFTNRHGIGSFSGVTDNLFVRNNTITAMEHQGIAILPGNFVGIIEFESNVISLCGNSSGVSGLLCITGQSLGTINVFKNTIYSNNSSDTGIQVNIWRASDFGTGTRLNAYGNCLDRSGVSAQFNTRIGTSLALVGNQPTTIPILGLETNYDPATTSKVFTLGGSMIHNKGLFTSVANFS
jgi:hypothetical protein